MMRAARGLLSVWGSHGGGRACASHRHAHSGPRLAVSRPLVEMDGDQVARVLWRMVKERLVLPYLDMDIVYHDLSLANRDNTRDKVTTDAARQGIHVNFC